jgi:hypothetical protein
MLETRAESDHGAAVDATPRRRSIRSADRFHPNPARAGDDESARAL